MAHNSETLASADVAIIGGGMSGLALACQIDRSNSCASGRINKAVVVEPRNKYQRDKTWCYWRRGSGLFDEAISHSWSRWEIRSAGRVTTSACPETPYVRVDSGRYYEAAVARLASSNTVGLKLGVSAGRVSQDQRQLCVDTARGQVRADRVIDTRPRPIPEGTLLQHFFGWEIETDKDVFDPTTVTLMDFSASTEEDVHFFYVLPFSSRRALVETTHFSKQQLCEAQYKDELRGYLRQRFALSNWHICSSEGGILPMSKRPPAEFEDQPNVVGFGLHGDTVKPSSGYCYPHAQQQAERIAAWLAGGSNSGPPAARHSVARWFDGVFVTFLENRSAQAPATFFRLFQRVKPAALVRFLSDSAQFGDYLRVIWAMPKGVMMREALRYALGR